MTFDDYLARLVVGGAYRVHGDLEAQSPAWAGALAAYDACLECESPPEIGQLLVFARGQQANALTAPLPDAGLIVFAESFVREMVWVCECVSALLLNEGFDAMTKPGSRAVLKCAELLGVAPGGVPLAPLRFLDSPATGTPECLCSFCGQPIAVSEYITLRAWDARGLELRACGDAACVRAFLSGVHDDATVMARAPFEPVEGR